MFVFVTIIQGLDKAGAGGQPSPKEMRLYSLSSGGLGGRVETPRTDIVGGHFSVAP